MTTTINANNRVNYILERFSDLNSQRIISIALPFLALHSKTAPISGAVIGLSQCYTLYHSKSNAKLKEGALLISNVAFGYFCPVGQLALSNLMLLASNLQRLGNAENRQEQGAILLQLMSQAIHVSSLYYGTPALIVLSLLSQATTELVHSYNHYQEGKTPELLAALLLAAIRLHKIRAIAFPAQQTASKVEPKEALPTLNTTEDVLPEAIEPALSTVKKTTAQDWKRYVEAARKSPTEPLHMSSVLKAEGRSLEIKDIDFSPLQSIENMNLSGLKFERCNFTGVRFKKIIMQKVAVSDCNFTSAFLEYTYLYECCFTRCDFSSIQQGPCVGSSCIESHDCTPQGFRLRDPSHRRNQREVIEEIDEGRIDPNFCNPSSPFTDFDHELYENFDAKLDAKRFTIIDTNNQNLDFGSHFHGYGKQLVKGANLQFTQKDNGVELSFRINRIFHEKLRDFIEDLDDMSSEEQSSFAQKFNVSEMNVNTSATYVVGKFPIPSPHAASAYKVHLKGVGSLVIGNDSYYNLKDRIKVRLNKGADLESFHHFLSIFGLEDALKKSSDEDIERLKLGVLFRTFYPSQAYFLEGMDEFFTLPVDELKQVIIDEVPKMEKILQKYTIKKTELLPGYVQYGAVIDSKAYDLGARALTTALTALRHEISHNQLSENGLNQLTNIIRFGLLSQEKRDAAGMSAEGLNDGFHYEMGGARSVYTQMVTKKDIEEETSEFGYDSPVRLFLSLEALNQSSYQYLWDDFGIRDAAQYISRPTLLEFLKRSPRLFGGHEIMLPDRVLPEHIKSMQVASEEIKQQIIDHLRKCNLIQEGETINGIPLDQFIRTDEHVTPELVQNCCTPKSPS